jgi:exopolysaccharide biosynthesis polyprenyl glycosylphosphotransferase
MGLAGVALAVLFTQQLFDSRFLAAASWLFAVAYVSAGRIALRLVKTLLYRVGIGNRRAVLIGNTPVGDMLARTLGERKELGYDIVARYPTFHAAAADMERLSADEVLYANPPRNTDDALAAIQWCIAHQTVFKYSADLFATYATNMSVHALAGIPLVEIRRTRLDGWGRIIKRLLDIAGSIVLIILTAPAMLAAALVILAETGRPIFYKNERVGIKGRRFLTLKFRSMYQRDCTGPQFGAAGGAALAREAELIRTRNSKTGPVYKIADDPRVTPAGRFLRRWSIDELPQFFNVLTGDMSIVGPRPHQPREVAQYETEHKKVLFIKPGITGLAQISGRSDLSFDEEAALDALYMEQWSLWQDAVIFVKTPFILFRKRNAL